MSSQNHQQAEIKPGDMVIRTKSDITKQLKRGLLGLLIRNEPYRTTLNEMPIWLVLDEKGKVTTWSSFNFERLEDDE